MSLALVWAGSGNVEMMARLRAYLVQDSPVDAKTSYGFNMAMAMSLGLLFLGGGELTLGNSNSDIAALIMAFYPHYPTAPEDNRYHLQALRHLYVIAVQRRMVVTRDVRSGQACHVPLTLIYRDGTRRQLLSPCALPPWTEVAMVVVMGPR